MLIWPAVTALSGVAIVAVIAITREKLQQAWGRRFDRELIRYLRSTATAEGSSRWLTASTLPEALYQDLIERSDSLTARRERRV